MDINGDAGSCRVGFLGPAGTFTEQALLTQPDLAAVERVAFSSFAEVLFAVAEGVVEYGFVAVENAIEGTVNITTDTLAFDVDLSIQREVILPVEMNLVAHPGTTLAEIRQVSSFPHAYAQCRGWLRSAIPDATLVPATSTAGAAQMVAEGTDTTIAAIANRRAAEVYGLEVLQADIEDHPENATRFLLVSQQGIPAPTGNDKTTIVVFQRADAPGSLLAILQEFAARRINLSSLVSRPTKTSLGDYCFMLDLNGHLSDELVADALRALQRKHQVKFLGSYPSGESGDSGEADAQSEEDAAAEKWVQFLRSQIRSPHEPDSMSA